LSWALDPADEFPLRSVVQVENGFFYDPHTNPALELAGREETIRGGEIMESGTRRVSQCRVVIITLGLIEVWYDTIANVFINQVIPDLLKIDPDRYYLHLTNFFQNLSNLELIHTLLTRFGHPHVQIIVTVSPVS